jgi:hypothetical protein
MRLVACLTRRSRTRRHVALAAIVALSVASAAYSAAGASASSVQVLVGQLMVAHGDSFDGGPMVMLTELRTTSGVVPLSVPASEHSRTLALAGEQVQVSGSRLARAFSVTGLSGAPTPAGTAHAVSAAAGSMRIAVVLMRLAGSSVQPVTKASVQASTFGATKSVADWYAQGSGGQVSVTGTVYGYYAGVSSCDLATQLAAGAAAAKKDGYVASNYDHLVVYTPDQGCGFAGMGWIGNNGVFLNGTITPGVMEHELGHNLGLMHAGVYACGASPLSASCLIEYGDNTDVMGNPYDNHEYSAQHKFALGWIPASEVRTVAGGTETIALTASEHPVVAGSTELIHVQGANGVLYAIDRRASVGYDTGLSGVWIRRVATVNSDDTEVVRSSALPAGSSFVDAAHQITITTVSDTGSTASVRVCVGACAMSATGTGHSPAGAVAVRSVTSAAKSAARNAGLSLEVPNGRGVAVGHTVVVSTYTNRASSAISCSDSRGNVYAVNVNSAGAQRLVVCSARVKSALTAGAKISIAYPAFSGNTVATADDVSGLAAGVRVDRTSSGGGSGKVADSRATARTTKAVEVVFGVVAYRGASAFSPGAGFAHVGVASYFAGKARMTIAPEFKIVSSMAAYDARGTLGSAQPWRAVVVTFFAS